MTYRFLGKTGVKVSTIAYGTMSFGGDASEADSKALFEACRDAGINVFDCADMYAGGKSEIILGKLIKDCREEVLITSKAYFATSQDVNAMGASRRHLQYSVEASLGRLQTDRIDIYFIHRFDDRTPLEETLRALDDLVHQGKVVYAGASNFAAWQVAKALGISAKEGLASFACIQPMYNLVKRQAEVEILPMAQANGVAVISYSPAGGGLLSGKYAQKDAQGRLATNKMYEARYGEPWMHEVAAKFAELCRNKNLHPVSVAVAWVGTHPGVTAPIIGARNLGQLRASLDSLKVEMSPLLRAAIADLSRTPPPATDRSEEAKK